MILAVLDCRQNLLAHSKSLHSASMKPTSSDTVQTSFLLPDLEKQLDPRRLLYRLARAIDWKGFEKTFGSLYSAEGRPALPIRRMGGLLMLKSLRNLSDEEYFCREKKMRWGLPCDPSELTHFRNRIGTEGAERILAFTIDLHGEKAKKRRSLLIPQSRKRTSLSLRIRNWQPRSCAGELNWRTSMESSCVRVSSARCRNF
jgi:hypothetical protein